MIKKLVIFGILIFFFLLTDVRAGNVTLAWDANTEPELVGYYVCYGTSSGNYTVQLDTGNVTLFVVSNLPVGTYYFAVKAYGIDGLESAYSNEVSATVTGVGSLCGDINSDGNVNVLDLQKLVNIILAKDIWVSQADVNKDGSTNVLDVQLLVLVLLGNRTCS